MNTLIVGPFAHFILCGEDEFEHGHIVLSDGRHSPPVFSKTEALKIVYQLLADKYLEDDEKLSLVDQINESKIPFHAPEEILFLQSLSSHHELDVDGMPKITVEEDFFVPINEDSPDKHVVH